MWCNSTFSSRKNALDCQRAPRVVIVWLVSQLPWSSHFGASVVLLNGAQMATLSSLHTKYTFLPFLQSQLLTLGMQSLYTWTTSWSRKSFYSKCKSHFSNIQTSFCNISLFRIFWNKTIYIWVTSPGMHLPIVKAEIEVFWNQRKGNKTVAFNSLWRIYSQKTTWASRCMSWNERERPQQN